MINFKQFLEEGGLWANIHAKRKRIKNGSGERMRKPGSKGAPSDADLKAASESVNKDHQKILDKAKTSTPKKPTGEYERKVGSYLKKKYQKEEVSADEQLDLNELNKDTLYSYAQKSNKDMEKKHKELAVQIRANKSVEANRTSAKLSNRDKGLDRAEKRLNKEEVSAEEQFDLIEEIVMDLAEANNIDSEAIWETLESVDDIELLEYAVDAKGHKSSTGGLTQKGRDSYNAKGGNLQAPVTTPPSKLKPGSKAANRRKSFCARMGGMEGAMKKPNGEPTRKALALRKWNC